MNDIHEIPKTDAGFKDTGNNKGFKFFIGTADLTQNSMLISMRGL
ncbi:hypothetical protein ADIAL_0771 [Alkalibacterium sp. AK22]|nr:hypothetical protein ADIAL_0771 [Alkalibacterium sp. AK22]